MVEPWQRGTVTKHTSGHDDEVRAPSGDLVLVTGGSGFVAGHLIGLLLDRGYRVRATLRALDRAEAATRVIERARHRGGDEVVEFVRADLTDDDGWVEAVRGARFVLHVASPFPTGVPNHEDEIVVPARDGTLRVLRAARAEGVERVVMTSSFAAIGYGHPPRADAFTEGDWTNIDAPIAPYITSKAVAERAAWDFDGGAELTVVNPVGIFGPALDSDLSSSIALALRMLNGMRGVPRLWTTGVDVRDVADLHLRAMTSPTAVGERYLASVGEPMSFRDIAFVLRRSLGRSGLDARSVVLPDVVIRLAARRNAALAAMVPELGKQRRVDSTKARADLGWAPRPMEEALAATATSLAELGLLSER